MKESIRREALAMGFDDCRFTRADPPDHAQHFLDWIQARRFGTMDWLERNAHKRIRPQLVLEKAKTIISLAASYHHPDSSSSASDAHETALVARYARYRDYHDVLVEPLKRLTEQVNLLGKDQEPRSLWYVDTGPFLERDLAQRAGLGFVGKHTNLIHRRLGNWFFISEIITTLELPPDEPEANHCGKCVRCLEACPTGAIPKPFQLDARRCISYLTIEHKGSIPEEFRPAIGNRIFGCDDCLEACPWNRFAQAGALMRDHGQPALQSPRLLELLELDEEAFRKRFRETPVFRTKRRGLLRNVCVALGNVGDASVLGPLEKAASDAEPLIAEHAVWAIQQIKSRCKEGHGTS